MTLMTPELLSGLAGALFGFSGSLGVAVFNRKSSRDSETTKRFEILFDSQGKEIERLSNEITELRTEFKKEQQLTEKLKEESSKWRSLLQTALAYLRRLHHWEQEGATPPPPKMPPELVDRLWQDVEPPGLLVPHGSEATTGSSSSPTTL